MRLILKKVSHVSLIEEEWLKEPTNLLVTPMLGHDVGGI
jgi:hypothetical protein